MGNKEESKRFGFLEGEDGVSLDRLSDTLQFQHRTPLDYCDFKADPKHLPFNIPKDKKGNPISFLTRGEISAKALTNLFWILVRITIVLVFVLYFLRGSGCRYVEFI